MPTATPSPTGIDRATAWGMTKLEIEPAETATQSYLPVPVK